MRIISGIVCLMLMAISVFSQTQQRQLRRAESFFGFHFDFHANPDDKEIGKTLTAGMIDTLLDLTKPDFIQVDCKGHAGYSSYPTKAGSPLKSYTQDILKLFREVTAKHNVALYVHYSGVWDQRAIQLHPWWGIVRADRSRDSLKTSFFSGYLDSLLIPQMNELNDVYHVNVAWVDGDSWAAEPDYSAPLVREFAAMTGIATAPVSRNDPDFKTFLEFNRDIFKRHIRKYIDAVHAHNPAFEITSNWAYSSLMPEPVEVNVDYLSGDVAGQNCVNNAAFQARCLALQGKPWDLMAWSFGNAAKDGFFVPKTLPHLEQEAAEVMAMGGGFQSYWTQNRDGSLKTWNYPQMADLAKFCRARQPFCQGSQTIPEIAVWYSVHSWKKSFDGIYAGGTSSLEAVLTLLLDGQHTVDMLMDHQIAARLSKYKLLIIPEWTDIEESLKQTVMTYVRNGGSVLVIGGNAVGEFRSDLGATFVGAPKTVPFYIGYSDDLCGIKSPWQPVIANAETKTIGSCYSVCDSRYPMGNPVGTIARVGKGLLAGFYVDIGKAYYSNQSPTYRKLIDDVINQIVPQAIVRVTGSENIHMVLRRKGPATMVHLINTGGSHFNNRVFTYDEVTPLGPIRVQVRQEHNPSIVRMQPGATDLDHKYAEGVLTIIVPKLDIHAIIEISD